MLWQSPRRYGKIARQTGKVYAISQIFTIKQERNYADNDQCTIPFSRRPGRPSIQE
jgi:hypothetical protein